MIKVYTGLKGFAVLLFFMAGMVLFLSVLFWGIAKAIELLMPLLVVISYLLIIVFVLGILPATFFKEMRPTLCVTSLMMSHALGTATWMMAFFFVIKTFGFGGVLLALLFQFLAPFVIIGALLKGSWHVAEHLSLWLAFTYGMRFYSQWLLNLKSPINRGKGHIIDVDVVEV